MGKEIDSKYKEERKLERRKKRSAFLSRMVDEFKKVMVLYASVFVTGFLVWEHIIYAQGITPAFPSAVTVALLTGFFGTIVAYCFASAKEKDSLNKNQLAKDKDGIIKKVSNVAETIVNTVRSITPVADQKVDDDAHKDDSDETPEE